MRYDVIVDSKVIMWVRDRATVEANSLEEAIELAKKGEYEEWIDHEPIYDTEETYIDSNGNACIEIMDENWNTLYKEGDQS